MTKRAGELESFEIVFYNRMGKEITSTGSAQASFVPRNASMT
ncbi:hypothetical protein [Chryseobacterium sp. ERMR1:04]|nr:hypothetical protein [Chryseobacterium sp. ERMR1:04]